MCGTEVFLHPALVADFHGIVCVAVHVVYFGGAAGEGDIVVTRAGIGLCIGQLVLQTVDTVVECAHAIVNHCLNIGSGKESAQVGRREIDSLVVAGVSREGTHRLVVLHNGEHTVAHSRTLVFTFVAVVGSLSNVAHATDRHTPSVETITDSKIWISIINDNSPYTTCNFRI